MDLPIECVLPDLQVQLVELVQEHGLALLGPDLVWLGVWCGWVWWWCGLMGSWRRRRGGGGGRGVRAGGKSCPGPRRQAQQPGQILLGNNARPGGVWWRWCGGRGGGVGVVVCGSITFRRREAGNSVGGPCKAFSSFFLFFRGSIFLLWLVPCHPRKGATNPLRTQHKNVPVLRKVARFPMPLFPCGQHTQPHPKTAAPFFTLFTPHTPHTPPPRSTRKPSHLFTYLPLHLPKYLPTCLPKHTCRKPS